MHPEIPRPHDLDWSDATFAGLIWENDGKDLRLFLAHASLPIAALRCSWASGLTIELNCRAVAKAAQRGGPLLTTEGRITRTEAGRWHVALAFGGDGVLQFDCEAIDVLANSAV